MGLSTGLSLSCLVTSKQINRANLAYACVHAQKCPTRCKPLDCSPPGSSAHGILQARTLGQVAMPFSRGSSRPRDRTCVSGTGGRFFTI